MMIAARQALRQRLLTVGLPVRSLHATSAWAKQPQPQPDDVLKPTNDARTSPKTSHGQHPGYTDAETPVTSAHPRNMPAADTDGTPSHQIRTASTRTDAQHPGLREMAKGSEIGGEDAVLPEERNVKNWGPNQRTPEFNQNEGRRNPVLHGGSNEGGHGSDGKSKT